MYDEAYYQYALETFKLKEKLLGPARPILHVELANTKLDKAEQLAGYTLAKIRYTTHLKRQ